MKDLKLIIDLLPKGAWGNNLSKTLPKKDWDTLREFAYKKARHRCAICGKNDEQLETHEVWDFDIKNKVTYRSARLILLQESYFPQSKPFLKPKKADGNLRNGKLKKYNHN